MTAEIIPLVARTYMAESISVRPFLFALSRGNPAWDSRWDATNPPAPVIDTSDVLDVFGYVRPTIFGYVTPDPNGSIKASGGGSYSVSPAPTRFMRVRCSIPVDSFPNEKLREVGLFGTPTIKPSVPAGQTVIAPADVLARGTLLDLFWQRTFVLEEGAAWIRNFVVRF